MQFLRMRPGHGEVVITEGDVDLAEDRERLIEEFRRQLDEGLWAAVPMGDDHREARMVTTFDEVPHDSERVIFFPRAAGGAGAAGKAGAAGGTRAAGSPRAAGGTRAAAGTRAAGSPRPAGEARAAGG